MIRCSIWMRSFRLKLSDLGAQLCNFPLEFGLSEIFHDYSVCSTATATLRSTSHLTKRTVGVAHNRGTAGGCAVPADRPRA
jgi:hypothetical protein